jgi:predicted metal-dependent peptidase
MTGRGGTDFNPIFEKTMELLSSSDKAPDILIFCTDGHAPPPRIRLPIPVVWLITPRGKPVVEEAGNITIEMRDYQLGESH